MSLRDARIQVHRALTRGGVRFEVAVELIEALEAAIREDEIEALEAAVREDEREKRETSGPIPAVAPCWCGDPRGIFHVRDGHPPVLNKRSGEEQPATAASAPMARLTGATDVGGGIGGQGHGSTPPGGGGDVYELPRVELAGNLHDLAERVDDPEPGERLKEGDAMIVGPGLWGKVER